MLFCSSKLDLDIQKTWLIDYGPSRPHSFKVYLLNMFFHISCWFAHHSTPTTVDQPGNQSKPDLYQFMILSWIMSFCLLPYEFDILDDRWRRGNRWLAQKLSLFFYFFKKIIILANNWTSVKEGGKSARLFNHCSLRIHRSI